MSMPRFKPYPAYKDSGVEWLGEIPAHWEIAPVYARYEVAKSSCQPRLCNLKQQNVWHLDPKRIEATVP